MNWMRLPRCRGVSFSGGVGRFWRGDRRHYLYRHQLWPDLYQ